MQEITLYKILTYILLPFAILFGLFALIMFFVGLANPVLLLPVFIIAGFSIYVFASLIFLTKGIDRQQPCKPSLKDWIKVNGYVASAMGIMTLINTITILFYPKTQLVKLATELLAAQPVKPAGISVDAVTNLMITFSYVFLVFSIGLLCHLPISFRLLKKYQYLFESKPQ